MEPFMKTNIYSLAALAFLIFTSSAFAATYYVDGSNVAASDSNPGSEALPLKTIQKGIDLAVAGDRVFVKAGNYAENLVMKNSGTEGNPIVIEGQKGTNGERLVTIEAGFLANNWQPAPEIGGGVYKNSFFFRNGAHTPHAITVDGKNLDRVSETFSATTPKPNMTDDSWKPYFASNLDLEADVDNPEHCGGNPACDRPVKFWDVTDGIFGTKNSGGTFTTYLRLKDRSNPNTLVVRASDAGQAIYFNGHSYITFKGFRMRGFSLGFNVKSEGTHHIIIEDNFISGAIYSISINTGVHDIIVRNNELNFDHYGFKDTGTWGQLNYGDDLRQAFYQWRHHWIFNSAGGNGISIGGGVRDIQISGNFIHEGMNGFSMDNEVGTTSNRVKINGNRIENFSSVGIVVRAGNVDLEIFDNSLYNNNINVRVHELDMPSPRKVLIYKNFFRQKEGKGKHFWFHWFSGQPVPNPPAEGYIYHNSFNGGSEGIGTNAYGYEYELIPGFYILNNLFSVPGAFKPGDNGTGHHFVGSFNYNWVGNLVKGLEWKYGVGKVPPWFGGNNIQSSSNYFWLPPGGDNFSISADSNVVDKGLDLSRAQDINGKTIGPLPGIASDYYCGSAPDIGAVQYCPVVAGCGDGVCVAGETPASCAADCNSGAVNCGTKGKFCAQNEYCSSGVCIKNGCPAPPIDFAKLKTYEGSWLNKIISMAEFMAKILEWKKCGARI